MAGKGGWAAILAVAALLSSAGPGRVLAEDALSETAPSHGTSVEGASAASGDGQVVEIAEGESVSTMRMDTISVTATRNPIEAFEYPGMVTVIGTEQIRARQPSTPDDILQFVPNVEFTGGPRRTGEVPSIRGFSGPDVVVLVDGARQNFNSGHDGRFFIDPSLIAGVEVLRGPSSALYGSGGTGGVIEFRTVRAEDLLAPEESYGFGQSFGYQDVSRERVATTTAYGRPLAGLDILGSFTYRDSGSIELGDGEELDQTDDDILTGLGKVSYEFADSHRIEGSFQRFTNNAEEPNNGQDPDADDQVDKEIQTDNWRLAYSYKNPTDDWLDLDLVAYYTAFEADELRLDDLGAGPEGELLKRDVDTIGFRADNRSRAMLSDDVGVTFTYGAEAYRDVQDGAAGSGDRDGVPDADADFVGVYAQAELAVVEPFGVLPGDLLVIPGLRFDYYRSDSSIADENQDEAVSPRLGVSYLPTDWSLVFANYAQAFRAPTFDELYLTGTHFEIPIGPGIVNRFVPNPDLKPQTTQTIEFGAGLDFKSVALPGDRFQIKGSHFRIWGEDFIDLQVNQPEPFVDCNPFIPGDCDGTTNSVNVPEARLWGTEIEAVYDSERLRVALGFSTIDGEDEDTGDKLGVLAPNQFTADTAVKIPEIDSIVGWRVLAADSFEKVNEPSEEREGYTVHDFYFAWAPSDGPLVGLRVDLGIDNAFDESYSRVFTGAAEAGRNLKALVSYSINW